MLSDAVWKPEGRVLKADASAHACPLSLAWLLQAHVMSIHITSDEVEYVHGILGQTLRRAEPGMLGGGVTAQVSDVTEGIPVCLDPRSPPIYRGMHLLSCIFALVPRWAAIMYDETDRNKAVGSPFLVHAD